MSRTRVRYGGAALFIACALSAGGAWAQDPEGPHDAGKHFRRGVELYGEANYSGALVEFKRAHALSPTSAALYDIGEAEFQLQDYAGALKTFRHFLSEYGPNENHRAEVETSVDVLASRVGVIRVTTNPPGADVSVDDQGVGRTPLQEPVLVSVGHHKLVATAAGRSPTTQYVDVAAGDDVPVALTLFGPSEGAPVTPFADERTATSDGTPHTVPSGSGGATRRAVGWITTGGLAAGAIVFGALAIGEANSLASARSGLTTSDVLEHRANLTTTFAVLADSLAVASILAGGFSLYWTLSPSDSHRSASARRLDLTLGPASAFLKTTF